MTEDNSMGPKKHFFPIPENFSELTDEQIEQFANQLHNQILETFGENFADSDADAGEEKNSNPDKKEKND